MYSETLDSSAQATRQLVESLLGMSCKASEMMMSVRLSDVMKFSLGKPIDRWCCIEAGEVTIKMNVKLSGITKLTNEIR